MKIISMKFIYFFGVGGGVSKFVVYFFNVDIYFVFIGYYVYIEFFFLCKLGDSVILGSVVFKFISICKLRFFYYMYGLYIGYLNVFVWISVYGFFLVIWLKLGD